jgi:hypothetical protein
MAEYKFIKIAPNELPNLFYLPDDQDSPELGGKNVYIARYRVLSQDGRLSSDWSQNFEIPTGVSADDIALTESEWQASRSSNLLNVTWNVNRLFTNKKLFTNKFHVYARFHAENDSTTKWIFMQETTATNFSTVIPANKLADVAVILPTYRGLDATTESPDSPMNLFPESVLFYDENI